MTIAFRFAENQHDRLPALAAELVDRRVVAIAATGGGNVILAAKTATPTIPIVSRVGAMQASVSAAGQQVVVLGAAADRDFEAGFAILAEHGVGALIVLPAPFLDSHREKLLNLTARLCNSRHLQWREFVQAGGLISYGTSLAEAIGI